ncbi:FAD-binding oxidoreductase [Hyphococcus formosus]|uniref:NAD(P)/FAD-dependent oxidoreductase n=1 Tax=Hyphococcus formosus TaxID=3143534 RepID=UPI00398B34AD
MINDPEHKHNYYAATAHPVPVRPALCDDVEFDVAIIGGGFTGVASALSLAERGLSVAIVEAKKVGWGASGRNGGQVLGGWSGEGALIKQLGSRAEEFFWRTRYLGNEIVEKRIEKYQIECDYVHGAATVAFNARQMESLEQEYNECAQHGFGDVLSLADKTALRAHVASDIYLGGLIDRRGAHCHPLNLCLGEAEAAEKLGVQIFEDTRVMSIDHRDRPTVHSAGGSIRAKWVILAGNAYHNLEGKRLGGYMLPAKTYISVTEPLPEEVAKSILPDNLAVCDANWVLDYYRLTPDGRLLFGGKCNYANNDITDIDGAMLPRMRYVFPQLKDIKFEYSWGGIIGIPLNRIPMVGHLSERVLYAQGYSGHGVNCSHIIGEMFADAIENESSIIDPFEDAKHFKVPAKDLIGSPLMALGMSYYRLRDKLGI